MKAEFTSYKDCVTYLYGLERAGIKYSLDNIQALLEILDNPHLKYKTVHIAGTNGKGSVSSIINSFLIESGFRTGLYTSPHIKNFRERITVNGKMIPAKYILDFTNRMRPHFKKIQPSFFEAVTALAFDYYAYKNVEYAVIETGLGGRLDSTNVVKPEVTVITSIGIDHTDFLGNTITSIAGEKAGIIKKSIPCVAGKLSNEALRVIKAKCKEKNSRLIQAENTIRASITKRNEKGIRFDIKINGKEYKDINFPYAGDYQLKNFKTSAAAIEELSNKNNITLTEKNFKHAFKNIYENSLLYGRFQLVRKNPSVIIDTSHNEQALSNIQNNLKYFKFNNLFIIAGMMKDKDIEKNVKILKKLPGSLILTKPNYKRAAEPEELGAVINNKGVILKGSLKQAFEYAAVHAGKKDLILITGSFFMAAEGLEIINKYYK